MTTNESLDKQYINTQVISKSNNINNCLISILREQIKMHSKNILHSSEPKKSNNLKLFFKTNTKISYRKSTRLISNSNNNSLNSNRNHMKMID